MSRWGNGKALTQATYGLIKEHPGMNRWAVRAAVYGAVVGGVGAAVGLGIAAVGGVLADTSDGSGSVLGIVAIVLGVLVLVLANVAGLTAANMQLAGLVSAADDVLHGRELDEESARSAARSRLRQLAVWSGISIAVGALVSLIQGDGDSGILATVVRSLLAGVVASLWAVVTMLALPVIVLENLGAMAAVKRSAGIIRSTWGEAILGTVRIGLRFTLIYTLPGAVLIVGGVALGVAVGGPAIAAGAVLAVVGVALTVVGLVKAATCRNVFGVALYRWANGEGALGPYSEGDLSGAIQVRGHGASVPA